MSLQCPLSLCVLCLLVCWVLHCVQLVACLEVMPVWQGSSGWLHPGQHCLGCLQRDRDVSLRELGSGCVLQLWFMRMYVCGRRLPVTAVRF